MKTFAIVPLPDLVLGCALAVAAEAELAVSSHGSLSAQVAALLLAGLAIRRSRPISATLLIGCALVAQAALGGRLLEGATALIGVAVAVFSTAWRCSLATAAVVTILVALGLTVGNQLDATTSASFANDFVFFGVAVAGAPALLGRVLGARSAQITLLRESVTRLAAEEEGAIAAARAEERGRLARSVHEAVAQRLGEIALQTAGAGRVASDDPERAQLALARVEETARAALDELRGIVGLLRAPPSPPR